MTEKHVTNGAGSGPGSDDGGGRWPVTVLDGSMGDLLVPQGSDALWSARVLVDAPERVVDLHRRYLDAGADVITTNSYATVPSYLAKAGWGHRYGELAAIAARLAADTVADHGGGALVAGSLPPLAESYRPDLVLPPAEARVVYQGLVEAMAPSVDVWLCETMSTLAEALVAMSAVEDDRPLYVALTLDETPGGGLRSGETVTEAVTALDRWPVAGILFNCTSPEAVSAALVEAREVTDAALGGYPNRAIEIPDGWTLDNDLVITDRDDFGTDRFVAWALDVVAEGATIVGGCCGVGPDDIAALRSAVARLA